MVEDEFYSQCYLAVGESLHLDLNQDITESNAVNVYSFLVHVFSD